MELFPPERESVRGLLKGLCEAHPSLRGKIFDTVGNLKPYILVLKNGRNVDSLQQLDTLRPTKTSLPSFRLLPAVNFP